MHGVRTIGLDIAKSVFLFLCRHLATLGAGSGTVHVLDTKTSRLSPAPAGLLFPHPDLCS
jgi:hypothetical protein